MRTNLIYALRRSRSTLLLCTFANEVYFALRVSNRKKNQPKKRIFFGQARAGNRYVVGQGGVRTTVKSREEENEIKNDDDVYR